MIQRKLWNTDDRIAFPLVKNLNLRYP